MQIFRMCVRVFGRVFFSRGYEIIWPSFEKPCSRTDDISLLIDVYGQYSSDQLVERLSAIKRRQILAKRRT